MKQADLLKFMRSEVERSKRWRDNEDMDDLWKRMIELYRGKHYDTESPSDRLVVNMMFATKNIIAPAVAINNPRFVINARKPENAPMAVIVEEVLNYLWRCNHYQDEVRLAVDDWIIAGHGWIKTGYKFNKEPLAKKVPDSDIENSENPVDGATTEEGIDDRVAMPGNVETEMIVTEDRPFLERISIFDMFVDPDARHMKEIRWIAQRTWRALQDVRVDERYDVKARKAASATSWSRWDSADADGRDSNTMPDQGAISYCEVIEFYDVKRKIVATFAMDGDNSEDGSVARQSGFLIKPDDMPYAFGHPFLMLRNYEVPDNFYPMGELESIESLQLELNETRTQMINHRKRFARKWVYARDMFDEDGVRALESDTDNTMIPILGDANPANYISPLPSIGTPPDFYNQSEIITNDINTIAGVSDYMHGAANQAINRSATEAAMIQDAANARSRDKLTKIESFLSDAGERIILLMQQYLTGDHVARITSVAGRAWVNYDADYLQGAYDFEVEGGSTEPLNESFRRQSALQLVDAMAPFVGAGVVNPLGLARYVLQYGFNIKDPSQLLNGPVEQMAQQQGVPPEEAVPGEESMLPPGAPSSRAELGPPEPVPAEFGGGPPIEQMPMGGPEIPPELMAQMAGP
jgi:hypothetical protein